MPHVPRAKFLHTDFNTRTRIGVDFPYDEMDGEPTLRAAREEAVGFLRDIFSTVAHIDTFGSQKYRCRASAAARHQRITIDLVASAFILFPDMFGTANRAEIAELYRLPYTQFCYAVRSIRDSFGWPEPPTTPT